jgi:hypothetical protein
MILPLKVVINYEGNFMDFGCGVHCNKGKVKENWFDTSLWLGYGLLLAC